MCMCVCVRVRACVCVCVCVCVCAQGREYIILKNSYIMQRHTCIYIVNDEDYCKCNTHSIGGERAENGGGAEEKGRGGWRVGVGQGMTERKKGGDEMGGVSGNWRYKK